MSYRSVRRGILSQRRPQNVFLDRRAAAKPAPQSALERRALRCLAGHDRWWAADVAKVMLDALKGELAAYDADAALAHYSPLSKQVRAVARDIIEGRLDWPEELHGWRLGREIGMYANPWQEPANMTPTQRRREHVTDIARARREAAVLAEAA